MRLVRVVTRTTASRGGHLLALSDQVVDLSADRTDDADRVGQACRAYDLFGKDAAGLFHLPVARCRGDETVWGRMASHSSNLRGRLSTQDGRRKPNSANVPLRRQVASEHAADLRHGDVGFIDEQQRVLREIFKQCRRRIARVAPCQVARIVLDAGQTPVASIISRSKVVRCSIRCASSRLPSLCRPCQLDFELGLDAFDGLLQRRLGGHVDGVGVDLDGLQIADFLAGQRVELL